jgi:hypothetical protein
MEHHAGGHRPIGGGVAVNNSSGDGLGSSSGVAGNSSGLSPPITAPT